MASQLAGLLVFLFVLMAIFPAIAMKEPSDDQILKKCGFSLQGILDCKYTKCFEASNICEARTKQEGAEEQQADCQMRLCMEAKTACESPLNNGLSSAEVCEGDKFDLVDTDCLLRHRKSLMELTECKAQGYLKVKRECFNNIWSDIIRIQAETLLKKSHVSDELVECALSSCFNSTGCFNEYHHDIAQNPASHRTFNLTLCAYVSTGYPYECDHRNCTLDITACKHLDVSGMPAGAVIAVLVVLVVVVMAAILVWHYQKRRCWGERQGVYQSTASA